MPYPPANAIDTPSIFPAGMESFMAPGSGLGVVAVDDALATAGVRVSARMTTPSHDHAPTALGTRHVDDGVAALSVQRGRGEGRGWRAGEGVARAGLGPAGRSSPPRAPPRANARAAHWRGPRAVETLPGIITGLFWGEECWGGMRAAQGGGGSGVQPQANPEPTLQN